MLIEAGETGGWGWGGDLANQREFVNPGAGEETGKVGRKLPVPSALQSSPDTRPFTCSETTTRI